MQIKGADGREADLAALAALLATPAVDAATRRRIERAVANIRAGVAAERDAAYEIEFHYGKLAKRATIHDLRLEIDGRVAQIDHLIIDRLLTIWVCESKHFAEGVGVNEHGEWTRFWHGRPEGMASPVEQNRKHIEVLRDVADQGLIGLPRRLGITLKPDFRSLILISRDARVSRPSSKATQAAVGLDQVVKVDRLKAMLDASIDTRGPRDVHRAVSEATVQRVGRELASLHRPGPMVDWAARFGLVGGGDAARPTSDKSAQPARQSGRGHASGKVCASCGIGVSAGVARYAEEHRDRFGGRILCMTCQRSA